MCALETSPVLATERLMLRRPVRADAASIAELANDLSVAGMTTNMPYPYRPADAETWLSKVERNDWRTDAPFAIEHRQFGVIGGLGFHVKDGVRAELGYWLGRPFWGRGYATEAVTAAMGWAKQDWRRKLVVAGHFADNRASGQVLCKADFLYTGDVQLRDSLARGAPVPTRMMVWLA